MRAPHVELPADARRPEPAPAGTTLTFRTSKGDFTVALDAEAPLTSGNLVALARQGYFRGITFHRVVPDFVAQGGDPRGDGEGGPGYSIRCEMTRRPYARGVLGMALSGKDTGGSQFFFTYSPQPHLDGRYTAFGEVTRGMEVVDRLLEGDTIQEVEVSPRGG
jgi:cyclophilin family peptidyl-prolyl cis-trans isomerase